MKAFWPKETKTKESRRLLGGCIIVVLLLAAGIGAIAGLMGSEDEYTGLDYQVLREWDLPSGGIGMNLLVPETAAKAQVMALADYLHSRYSRGWLFISIYDSRETYAKAFQETLSEEEFLKHVLVQITRNPTTGYDEVTWLATERGY